MQEQIVLSREELRAITGYKLATKQLNVLHQRGFHRAYISSRGGVILERAHYEAVARGTATPAAPKRVTYPFVNRQKSL